MEDQNRIGISLDIHDLSDAEYRKLWDNLYKIEIRVVPLLSVVGWKTFPKASKRGEMAENLAEKCQLRLSAHLCSFWEGQQHSRG